jgi:predicted tellurium resistance membrane protein TerC
MEFSADAIIALITLAGLEIVLGIDNVVFIAILCGKLPPEKREKARKLGLFLAMFIRILLLLSINWIMGLTKVLFTLPDPFGWFADPHTSGAATQVATLATTAAAHSGLGITGKDLILILGGLFLIFKATMEIHEKLEGDTHLDKDKSKAVTFGKVLIQILLLDIVFSLDSVITAVGMASKYLWVMIAAVIIAVGVMMAFSGYITRYIEKHPTLKILALSFLVLIGVVLVVEGFHGHVAKGYIYFAMAFSVIVEMINIRFRKVSKKPVELHEEKMPDEVKD